MCLNEICFPDCWKVSSVLPTFKNVGKRSMAKNYSPVSLLSVVGKIFILLMNSRNVFFFSDFQYGCRSSHSIVDLLTDASDRIAGTFTKPEATRAVALDISKAFVRVGHASILYTFKSYQISVHVFSLISSFLSN